jgi:hypothetical protein
MATDDVGKPLPPAHHPPGMTDIGRGQRASAPHGETFWSIDVYRFKAEQSAPGRLASYRVPLG